MRIEAVTVCVGYGDFLAETLPWNMQQFDRMVVVTSYEDKETQALCRRLSVECRPTDVGRLRGETFNKGRMVDFGIGFCSGSDWMLHLDADTWLPPMTRHHLQRADLDEEGLYGIDRVLCPSYEHWQDFLAQDGGRPRHQHDYQCRVHIPHAGKFPLGDRISLPEHSGYIPIGFFQLWHGRTKRRYPMCHGTAERTDVLFALQWPSRQRHLLGEVIGVHLESEPGALGVNWEGRKTRRFEPRPHQAVGHHHEPRPYC